MPERARYPRKKIIDAISWVIFTRAERGGTESYGAFTKHDIFVSNARSGDIPFFYRRRMMAPWNPYTAIARYWLCSIIDTRETKKATSAETLMTQARLPLPRRKPYVITDIIPCQFPSWKWMPHFCFWIQSKSEELPCQNHKQLHMNRQRKMSRISGLTLIAQKVHSFMQLPKIHPFQIYPRFTNYHGISWQF